MEPESDPESFFLVLMESELQLESFLRFIVVSVGVKVVIVFCNSNSALG